MAANAAGILQSWGTIGQVLANRCLRTAFILALGSIAFLLLNTVFGVLGVMIFEKDEPKPNIDPAFRERLKAAKMPPQEGQGWNPYPPARAIKLGRELRHFRLFSPGRDGTSVAGA